MADAAERHLLFGMIALQVGLIDQAQLVAAFQAWARDKDQPLAEHLAARGAIDAADRAAVDGLAAHASQETWRRCGKEPGGGERQSFDA